MAAAPEASPPHILVIGGEWDVLRGGSNALCYQLLSNLPNTADKTILGHNKLSKMSPANKSLLESSDLDYQEPDDSNSKNDPTSFMDVLNRWETFHADLEYSDITHILVVNPYGIVALSDTKLVDHLMHHIEGEVKVAVLNYIAPDGAFPECTDVDLLGWTRKYVSLIMTVGPHLHRLWELYFKLDRMEELISHSYNHFQVPPISPLKVKAIKNASSCTYNVHTLPCSPEFVFRVAQTLGRVGTQLKQYMSVAWTVWQYSQKVNEDHLQKLQDHLQKLLRDSGDSVRLLTVKQLDSLLDLKKKLSQATLVIQEGTLNEHSEYSGLETLMCGLPTLIPNDSSQLSGLLMELDATKARYFVLSEHEEQWNDDVRNKWCSKVAEVLSNEEDTIANAKELKEVLDEHSKDVFQNFYKWLGTDLEPEPEPVPEPEREPELEWSKRELKPYLRLNKDFSFSKDQLGEGGQGSVFKGRFNGETDVAVKCIHYKNSKLKHLTQEMELLQYMQHENIVKLYGICIEDTMVYIVMDLLPFSMADKIHQAKQGKGESPEKKISVALGCTKALVYIHEKHIVHQDIKGQNIMLTSDLTPKLVDFGLARVKMHIDKKTTHDPDTSGGTEYYFAPERFECQYRPQKPSDVWSMCCTLVEWFNPVMSIWSRSFRREILSDQPQPGGLSNIEPQWVQDTLREGFQRQEQFRPTAQDLQQSFESEKAFCPVNQSALNNPTSGNHAAATRELKPLLRLNKDFSYSENQKLGKGGQGSVFKGRFNGETDVAVKCIHSEHSKPKNLVQEMELLKNMKHENIVKLYGICIEDTMVYIVMDLLPLSMADKIHEAKKGKGEKLSPEKKISVALGCTKALVYIHEKHIVHQDIKGDNIMLTEDLIPKLVDFGFARVKMNINRKTTQDQHGSGGTEYYCAPERFDSQCRPQKPSDVWSMCCTLVEWFNPVMSIWSRSFRSEILSDQPQPRGLSEIEPQWVQDTLREGFQRQEQFRPTAQHLQQSFESETAFCPVNQSARNSPTGGNHDGNHAAAAPATFNQAAANQAAATSAAVNHVAPNHAAANQAAANQAAANQAAATPAAANQAHLIEMNATHRNMFDPNLYQQYEPQYSPQFYAPPMHFLAQQGLPQAPVQQGLVQNAPPQLGPIPPHVQNLRTSSSSSAASTPLKKVVQDRDSGHGQSNASTSSSETPLKQPVPTMYRQNTHPQQYNPNCYPASPHVDQPQYVMPYGNPYPFPYPQQYYPPMQNYPQPPNPGTNTLLQEFQHRQPKSPDDNAFDDNASPFPSAAGTRARGTIQSDSAVHDRTRAGNSELAGATRTTQRSFSSPSPSTSSEKSKKSKKKKDSVYYSQRQSGGASFSHTGLKSSFSAAMDNAKK